MPRLRQVPRSDITDRTILQCYDLVFGPDRDPVARPGTATGTPGNWWTVFALVPDVFEHAVRGFGLYRSPARKLDPVLRELAQARAGWAVGSRFVYSQHCKSLRELGVGEDKIAAVRDWQVADCFDEKEIAVLAYADCLATANGRVPDGIFAKLKSFLSDEEILELTYIACMYAMHAVISRALRLEYDDRDDPVAEIAAPK
jgi:alkylhydroperoxidase family enzyme